MGVYCAHNKKIHRNNKNGINRYINFVYLGNNTKEEVFYEKKAGFKSFFNYHVLFAHI